ncbi:hypothetical protein HDV04_002710 [Boothiomyces sp. JEL0838]|nr:hypothetical protein HDV04_002710 [Boothiomyces sp. JEL0838]
MTSRAGIGPRRQPQQFRRLSDNLYEQEVIVDDDLTLYTSGRKSTSLRSAIYIILCVITGGIYYLICRWNTTIEMKTKTFPCSLADADYICIKNQWGEISLNRITKIDFGMKASMIFPRSFTEVDASQDIILDHLRFYEYRYFKFFFNPNTGMFEPNYAWVDSNWTSVSRVFLEQDDDQEIHSKRSIFGKNQVEIQEKSNFRLLVDEVLHPFFVFQIASIILWSLDDYYYYAGAILFISVTSSIATFLETKRNINRMKDLSRFSCHVRLLRNGVWVYMNSEEMVPGDLFEIESGSLNLFPCDAVLLTGDCIVNESMLTGESLPVSKSPIPDQELASLDFEAEEPASSPHMSKYFLFSGTKIIRIRPGNQAELSKKYPSIIGSRKGAIALVVRTGFNTTKGSLIRSMLFPRPNTFKFYRDAFRFIGVLAVISGLGFLGSLYNFVKLGINWETIIIRALDLITIAVPPALPATMAIGTSFAISRLRKSGIFCTSPPRVNIGGKINIMCFDKTGTLTEEGLDVLGVRFTVPNESRFESPYHEIPSLQPVRFSRMYRTIETLMTKPVPISGALGSTVQEHPSFGPTMSGVSIMHSNDPNNPVVEPDFPYPLIICAMATCHSIKVVGGDLMGDPLDLKMFQFTNWNIEEDFSSSVAAKKTVRNGATLTVRPPWVPAYDTVTSSKNFGTETFTELGVVKSFEFVSNLRRQSVIVQRFKYSGSTAVGNAFTESSSDPGIYPEYEVFVKGAPEVMQSICDISTFPKDYNEQLRYYTHHGYRVIAVAYKKLESMSLASVQKLKRQSVETGLLFLGFIIFENKLKPGTFPVIKTLNKAAIRQVMCTGDNVLTSISVSRECGLVKKSSRIFIPRFESGQSHEEDARIVWEDVDDSNLKLDPVTFKPNGDVSPERLADYQMAITGDAFQWMLEFASDEIFEKMLVKTQIFARMSPDQKHFLVENLQHLGYCVGFCGDGTNDCGALKSADIGLSLSEAEASVAAPFTSNNSDLECVLQVIREGRAALVTSFCCFKYMALYSLIQFTSVSLMYSLAQNIGDFQFMYIDICLIIPIAVFMGQTGPHPSIHPKRPTASLVSKKVLTSLIGQVVLSMIFQIGIFVWVRSQPWYKEGIADIENQTYLSMENTVVFLSSCYQYVIVAIVFTVGPPYQASIWKNVPLISVIFLIISFTTYLTLLPPTIAVDLLEIVVLPWDGRVVIVAVAIFNFVASWLVERYVIFYLVKFLGLITERIRIMKIDRNVVDTHSNYSLHRLAKIEKWRQSGKKFKIIRDEFK